MIHKPLKYSRKNFSQKKLIHLYKAMLKPRMIEQKMLILLRQGIISKWFAGIGEEAISVGCTEALHSDEMVFSMHRNLGVFTSRSVPFHRLFAQWKGKPMGFTNGRDRSFHFGTMEYNIAGMISHLGPQLSLASGVGLSYKLDNEAKVALVFSGDGGTSQGEFHEAMNVAAVWQLPVIFVVNSNGYGLSTPSSEQYRCKDLADRALGYGMKSKIIDGNNILEVYKNIKTIAKKIRKKPEPYFIEAKTFRIHGHEEASGVKYVPPELISDWKKRDPIDNFQNFLLKENVLTEEAILNIKAKFKEEIETGLKTAIDADEVSVNKEKELTDVYAPFEPEIIHPEGEKLELRMIDAVQNAIDLAMDKYDNLVLMGQDIAGYGGVFKATEGLLDKYGAERVRNTPLCESAILGIGIGMSMRSYKTMIEMQFADFVSCGFNQIVNNAAKLHYRWGQNVDMVVRMPTGAGIAAGPYHSQSNEAWFTHVPGLKVVYPSNPVDAKGLLLAAFEDPNPVLFFEHKALYRSGTMNVASGYYTDKIGEAKCIKEGDSISILTYGMGVIWAEKAVEELEIDAEIIDLRTLVPIDYEVIRASVIKCGRALILHEDNLFGGLGGELAAYISEHLFEYLDAPVLRVASMDTPIPFNKSLEDQYLPYTQLLEKLEKLISY